MIDLLSNRELQTHGFNRLIVAVKNLDAENNANWKENGWLDKLKFSLFRYFDAQSISELSSDQVNRGLILLNHSILVHGSLYYGEEETILRLLFQLLDLQVPDKRSLIRGAISVRKELLTIGPQLRPRLLKVAFDDFYAYWDKPITTNHHKVFLLSTFVVTVERSTDLGVSLDRLKKVISAGLNSNDAVIRKETYPVLLHLMKEFSSSKEVLEEKILSGLKEGERRLLDYYLTSSNANA